MRQCLVFEVADHKFDRRVIAVIDIGDERRDAAVGRKAVMAPIGEQFGLRADQAGAAHDQPAALYSVSAICASPSSG